MLLSRTTIDFLLFNVCWMANLYSGIHSRLEIGLGVTVLALGIHLIQDRSPGRETLFLILVALTGYGWDTVLLKTGYLAFSVDGSSVLPIWLLTQWFAFGIIFRDTLEWMRKRYVLATVLGATGGPLSYYSASRFDLFALGSPTWQSILVMACGWGLLIPLYQILYDRLRDTG